MKLAAPALLCSLVLLASSFRSSLRPCIPQQTKLGIMNLRRPIDLCISSPPDTDGDMITLESSVTRFLIQLDEQPVDGAKATVDLYSMLHVADPAYYSLISDKLLREQYDIVLYELITSKDNVDEAPSADLGRFLPFKKRSVI